MSGKKEYGDYQTPIEFTDTICHYLKYDCGINPTVVVEPTCGFGNFLKSSMLFNAEKYYGIEINSGYCKICKERINDERVTIINSNIFEFSLKSLIAGEQKILVIGNPPWVTNSELSSIGSVNIPIKRNFKKFKGIEAITGASNFDICEYIILQMINEFCDTDTVIAMLCKTSVARNVFEELIKNDISVKSCDIVEFDAAKVFKVNVSACLLVVQLSSIKTSLHYSNIYNIESPKKIKNRLEYKREHLYSNFSAHPDDFYGKCCFEWRQGVKHDCSKVMELDFKNGLYQNGQNENVQIESDIVFPLVKSSMFKTPIIHNFSKYVIVTQKQVREETIHLKYEVPKTWQYLSNNVKMFENRKSSIYKNAPLFSMFGVGDYSFSRYKVGVSGFYKKPMFSVLYSDNNKPVMADDTSYFICFDNFDIAYVAMLLLNSYQVQDFLTSITFLDSKRPYTKKILDCIDFNKIITRLSLEDLLQTERCLNLPRYITDLMYYSFKLNLNEQ